MNNNRYVSKYWKITEKRFVYTIVAYFSGGIAGSIIAVLVATVRRLPFLGVCLPIFIGSMLAGFAARQKGWLVALTLTLLVTFAIYIGTPLIFGREYSRPFSLTWVGLGLLVSAIAGHLGELLAQKRHKRSGC
jgi:ABC-type enterochelin transport system permease subunit